VTSRLLALAALVTFTGCDARLADGVSSAPDADTGGGGGGGGGGSDAAVTTPDAPRCSNGRVVYLAFEGVTLTQGTPSDATQNRVSWLGVLAATVPPYLAGNSNRAAAIAAITTGVRSQLDSFPVSVVTTRPATGPYVMIVFGGTNQIVGTPYTYATNEHDCGDLVKSDVGWMSDVVPAAHIVDYAIGTIGWGLGLNGTTDPDDCMCGWATQCTPSTAPCTLKQNIATQTSASPATTCPGMNPQNEYTVFEDAFCK
jgi:hypothetical protein